MNNTKHRGILVLEPAIIMVLFIFVFALGNNGVVSLIRNEWHNAAKSGATAGMQKLLEGVTSLPRGIGGILINFDPNFLVNNAKAEAKLYAQLHQWMGGAINDGQVKVTVGTWINCTFSEGLGNLNNLLGLSNEITIPMAVRVDIIPPTDGEGNATGITRVLGRIRAPFLQRLPSAVTAVASFVGTTVLLVEYEGEACNQIIL